ncbi:hypothetical protein E7X19_23640 [Bacteroides fragilis]|nr:hypothetical protein E7X19_23640 [Bacteroides fragilis]
MELKLGKGSACLYCRFVLIVPYGIEIQQYRGKPYPDQVLIVPYGIEICAKCKILRCAALVLIVPYGIRTKEDLYLKVGLKLYRMIFLFFASNIPIILWEMFLFILFPFY